MKTWSFSAAILLVCLAVANVSAGTTQEFKKEIVKEFSISPDGEVEIHNKYGHIDIIVGESDMVKMNITITVDARNQEKANEVFSRVDIATTNSSSFVRASTEINTSKGWDKWWNGGDKFEISYKVEVPATATIDLENKYGDIYVASKEADAQINIKYGNLRMDGITGELDLDIGYGKGSVTSAGDVDLVMKYSNLRCGTLGNVRAETKYSGFAVEELGDLRSTSSYDNYDLTRARVVTNYGKYDDFHIGEADAIEMETKYSNLVVKNLHGGADLNFRYGGIELERVSAGFDAIDVKSEYTGVKISVESSANFTFEGNSTYCGIRYNNLDIYIDKQTSKESEVKGYRGSRDAKSSITINAKYGSVKIN